MKKTQFIDTRRNISKQFVSFFSIAAVGMLAVAAYLGINFASDALIKNATVYMDRLSFRDIDVTSTMLLTEDDIEAIKAVEGVTDVEGVYQVTSRINKAGESDNALVDVMSATERISVAEIVEGRLPDNFFECAVEKELSEKLGLKIGDTVNLCGSDGKETPGLRHKAFMITGIFLHADHYTKEAYSAGNRYVIVTDNSFDNNYFNECFLRAVIKLDRPDGMGIISSDYDKLISGGVSRIEALADKRAPMREESVKDQLRVEISEGQKRLDEAKKELDDGRRELDENARKISDGEKELEDSWKKLEDAKKQLSDAKKKLDAAKAELDANKPKLDAAKKELDAAAAELTGYWNRIEDKKAEIRDNIASKVNPYLQPAGVSVSWAGRTSADVNDPSLNASVFRITNNVSIDVSAISSGLSSKISEIVHGALDGRTNPDTGEIYTYEDIEGYIAQINNAIAGTSFGTAVSALNEWNNGHSKYISGRNEYLAAKKKYDDGAAAYEAGLAEYQDGFNKYDRGLYKYNQGVKELEDGKAQLAEGEEKYAEGLKQYEEGLEELQNAKDTVAGLNPCRWVVLDAYGSPSYVQARSSAVNIRKLAMTFAMLFVLIGALVIYATVARIIDEQRKQLGTVKALGLYNREAAAKYRIFGISATLLGVILGTALGYFVIQWVALMSHEVFYVTDGIPRSFDPALTGVASAAGILIALFSVRSACSELVKQPAVDLMKEKMPAYKVKAVAEKAKNSSLYSKLIARNMRNDARRIFVTVISVAGCCILLVIGFTMRNGILNALERQYNELLKYTMVILFDPETSETAEREISELLDDIGIDNTKVYYNATSFKAGNELNICSLICVDQEELDKNFNLTDMTTGKPLILGDQGVYIPRRISVNYHLSVGDTITIYDDVMTPSEAPIAGVFQCYFQPNIIMSKNAYKDLFGEEAEADGFLIRNCYDLGGLSDKLTEITGFERVQNNRELYNNSSKAVSALNIVVIVLILAAGIMAYFILLNLANMYINQKKRELTIMRVNGFTTGETISYVAREAVITTIIGIILGITLGSVFGYAILRFVEQRQAGFVLTPDLPAWILSACITAAYSFIIYAIALRKVKALKLTDIS